MEPKERAIETLESLTHWLKTSRFDYDIDDLNCNERHILEDG